MSVWLALTEEACVIACSQRFPRKSSTRSFRISTSFRSRLKEFLHRQGEPVQYVYFPGDGFVSVVTVLEDGDMAA